MNYSHDTHRHNHASRLTARGILLTALTLIALTGASSAFAEEAMDPANAIREQGQAAANAIVQNIRDEFKQDERVRLTLMPGLAPDIESNSIAKPEAGTQLNDCKQVC